MKAAGRRQAHSKPNTYFPTHFGGVKTGNFSQRIARPNARI